MQIQFGKDKRKQFDTAVIALDDKKALSSQAKILDDSLEGLITHALDSREDFTGKYGQSLALTLPKGGDYKTVVLIGLGEPEKLCTDKIRVLGGKLWNALKGASAKRTVFLSQESVLSQSAVEQPLLLIAEGLQRRGYEFCKYKTKKDDKPSSRPELVALECEDTAGYKKSYEAVSALIEGVNFAKELTSEPANVLYPESFAEIVEKELKPLGVKVKVLDEKKLEKMGAGGLINVGKGSSRPPRLVILEYNGIGKSSKAPETALVGKGITFDTGGYCLKPADSMSWMFFDMGGAGIVAGTMRALAQRGAKTHVVAALALAENMISGDAYRPSDIIKTLSGQTVEVVNTDAEGRLVLCDAMTYVQNEYKPKKMVDVATLTGAAMVALGTEYGGVFTQDEGFWADIEAAGKVSGDKLWRMPMDEVFSKEMESHIADLRNLGRESRFGGASTAAAFLERFVGPDVIWAHIDVAGTVWSFKDKELSSKGATGHGVAALTALLDKA